MNFKLLEISDHALFEEMLLQISSPSQNYYFAALFYLRHVYNIHIAHEDDILIVRNDDHGRLYYPICTTERLHHAVELICNEACGEGIKADIQYLTLEQAEYIDKLFPEKFTLQQMENGFEYLYDLDEFVSLEGGGNKRKKQEIKTFERRYPNYRLEQLNSEQIPACLALLEEWEHSKQEHSATYQPEEVDAMRAFFNYYEILDIIGHVLLVDDVVIGYMFYGALTSKMFLGICTKVDSTYKNAQRMLFHLIVNKCKGYGFKMTNFGDDNDSLSLRYYKERLKPVEKLYHYQLIEK